LGPEGAKELAVGLAANSSVTDLNLSANFLEDKCIMAICTALQSNKETKLASLNVRNNEIGPEGAKLVAAIGSVTVVNILRNQLDSESAKMLADVAKQKGISLCGIQRDQTTADFSLQDLKPPDAILLASDLSQAGVAGSVTVTDMRFNSLDSKSATMLANVAKEKGISLCGITPDQTEADLEGTFGKRMGPADAILLTADLAVRGSITSLNLASNNLAGETYWVNPSEVQGSSFNVGDKVVYKGLEMVVSDKFSDGDIKMVDMSMSMSGVKALADSLAVNGSLTSASLLGNNFDDEAVAMLLKVKEEKPVLLTLCGLKPDQAKASFMNWGLLTPADAKLLAPEIAVHRSVTELNLHCNQIKDAGVLAICEALQSNKDTKLASLTVSLNAIGPEGAKSVAAMVAVTSSMTRLDMQYNPLGEEGKAVLVLREAIEGRTGFELLL